MTTKGPQSVHCSFERAFGVANFLRNPAMARCFRFGLHKGLIRCSPHLRMFSAGWGSCNLDSFFRKALFEQLVDWLMLQVVFFMFYFPLIHLHGWCFAELLLLPNVVYPSDWAEGPMIHPAEIRGNHLRFWWWWVGAELTWSAERPRNGNLNHRWVDFGMKKWWWV